MLYLKKWLIEKNIGETFTFKCKAVGIVSEYKFSKMASRLKLHLVSQSMKELQIQNLNRDDAGKYSAALKIPLEMIRTQKPRE